MQQVEVGQMSWEAPGIGLQKCPQRRLSEESFCRASSHHFRNVRRWVDDIMPLLANGDPLGVDSFATHHLPLSEAPSAYEHFQKKEQGMVKVVFNP